MSASLLSTAGVSTSVRRMGGWIRRRLIEPERPLSAIEIRASSVGVVRAVREGGKRRLVAAVSLELPPDTLSVSMVQPNVLQPEALRETLRAALERAGLLRESRVALVLPDAVGRIVALTNGETPRGSAVNRPEHLRFRLRKSVPFEIRDARLAWASAGGRTTDPLLVAAVARPVLDGYEQCCRALGLESGWVELCGLALGAASIRNGHASGDRLVVNADEGYVTMLFFRNAWPILVRTLTGESVARVEDVAREAANTVLYARERLGSEALGGVQLRWGAGSAEDAMAALRSALDIEPVWLDPLGSGAAAGAGQALAGAAACVMGGGT